MNIAVISPKCTSKSARYLAEAIGAHYENPYKTGRYNFTEFDKVINWGFTRPLATNSILNHFDNVCLAVDKIKTFEALAGKANIVSFTTSPEVAHSWNTQVVARKLSDSSKSKGIEHVNSTDLFAYCNPEYKLFTKYIDHIGEFRINVFKGKVVSMLEKTVVGHNFEFKLVPGEPIDELADMVKAVDANLHLDFYGLDVVFDEDNKPILLEVNSAPMLFGVTGQRFVKLIQKEMK